MRRKSRDPAGQLTTKRGRAPVDAESESSRLGHRARSAAIRHAQREKLCPRASPREAHRATAELRAGECGRPTLRHDGACEARRKVSAVSIAAISRRSPRGVRSVCRTARFRFFICLFRFVFQKAAQISRAASIFRTGRARSIASSRGGGERGGEREAAGRRCREKGEERQWGGERTPRSHRRRPCLARDAPRRPQRQGRARGAGEGDNRKMRQRST